VRTSSVTEGDTEPEQKRKKKKGRARESAHEDAFSCKEKRLSATPNEQTHPKKIPHSRDRGCLTTAFNSDGTEANGKVRDLK